MAGVPPQLGAASFDGGSFTPSAGVLSFPSQLIGGRVGARLAGVCLKLVDGGEDFAVTLVGRCGSALLTLGPFPEDEVVAVWRGIAASAGLPLLVHLAGGILQISPPSIGAVQLGPVRIRRRHALLNGRRPRFLLRRKIGRCPARPRIHREREIVAGSTN